MDKFSARNQAYNSLSSYSHSDLFSFSLSICELFKVFFLDSNFSYFACFYPLKNEPFLLPLYEWLLFKKKTLFFPRYNYHSHSYEFCPITNFDSDFISGKFNIMEPKNSISSIDKNDINHFIQFWFVPGLMFDVYGNRCGKGFGYYDRILFDVYGIKCGVCFDFLLSEAIPNFHYDINMDLIFSNKRCFSCLS